MASDQNLILEIDEALKREKTEKMLKEYGPYIVAGAVLAVLFTGLISGYRTWENKVSSKQTAALMQAMTSEDQVKSLEELAPSLRPGPRAIALMTAASNLMQKGQTAEAKEVFAKTSADKTLPALYRDLATLSVVRLSTSGDTKDVDAKALLAQLQPLMAKGNPWRWHAHVESALINANMLNDYATARAQLAPVISANEADAPPSLLTRARALDQVFGQKTSAAPKTENKTEKKTDATPEAEG